MPTSGRAGARLRLRATLLSVAVIALASAPAIASAPTASARPSTRVAARAATASARPFKMIWGPVTMPGGTASAFPTYHKLGVRVLQLDLRWNDVAASKPANPQNPSDPAYHWPAELDQAVAGAGQYHIRLCLLVDGTPPWANGSRSTAWAPDNPSDYGDFLIAASRRYPSVKLWMIWGEPNRVGAINFLPMPANSPVGPRRYALVLDAAYHALKQVSRANIVIGGNTWSFGTVEPADFVRWMKLPGGKPPPLDYYGHNPFGRRFPNLKQPPYFPGGRDINDIDTLEKQLHGIYHRRVKLWLSEFTISSDHSSTAFDFWVSRKKQAHWLTAAFKLVDSVNYVAGLGWFNLIDDPPSGSEHLTNGLLTWDLKRKPAFYAYEHAR